MSRPVLPQKSLALADAVNPYNQGVISEARLFHLLTFNPATVIRGYEGCACDGAVYCGDEDVPESPAGQLYDFLDKYCNRKEWICFDCKSFRTGIRIRRAQIIYSGWSLRYSATKRDVYRQRQATQFYLVAFESNREYLAILPSAYAYNHSDFLTSDISNYLTVPPSLSPFMVHITRLEEAVQQIKQRAIDGQDYKVPGTGTCLKSIPFNYQTAVPLLPGKAMESSERMTRLIYHALKDSPLPIHLETMAFKPKIADWRIVEEIAPYGDYFVEQKVDVMAEIKGNFVHRIRSESGQIYFTKAKRWHFFFTAISRQPPVIAYLIPRAYTRAWEDPAITQDAYNLRVPLQELQQFRFVVDSNGRWVHKMYDIVKEHVPSLLPPSVEELEEATDEDFGDDISIDGQDNDEDDNDGMDEEFDDKNSAGESIDKTIRFKNMLRLPWGLGNNSSSINNSSVRTLRFLALGLDRFRTRGLPHAAQATGGNA
ncbi:MAG: hypothetical protein Q9187_003949 [Circinaria calcarea]